MIATDTDENCHMKRSALRNTTLTCLLVWVCTTIHAYPYQFERHMAAGMQGSYQQSSLHIHGTRIHYWLADDDYKRSKGLLGVTTLEDYDGMLFVFPKPINTPFHMHGMLIPLDFVWIRHGKVVDLKANVKPEPLYSTKYVTSKASFDHVLELKAGSIAKLRLNIGDHVR